MKVAIFGIGGLGRELFVLHKQCNDDNQFIGWFDDTVPKGTEVMGYPVLGGMDALNEHKEEIGIFIGLGDARTRKKIVSKITNANVKYPSMVHPEVEIEDYQDIRLGKGVVIQKGCILTTNISLGEFVFLNLDCTVGHDTNIGKFSAFMPGVHVSGDCEIKDACYFGTNATVINALTIGKGSIIGANACVSKNVEANTVNVGVPSKSIKTLEDVDSI